MWAKQKQEKPLKISCRQAFSPCVVNWRRKITSGMVARYLDKWFEIVRVDPF